MSHRRWAPPCVAHIALQPTVTIWVANPEAATDARPVAGGLGLPLALTHDVGDVGLVWREARPDPAFAALLDASGAAGEPAS